MVILLLGTLSEISRVRVSSTAHNYYLKYIQVRLPDLKPQLNRTQGGKDDTGLKKNFNHISLSWLYLL